MIPYDAVYYDNTGAYVYLCQDGRAVKTYVATDIFDDTTIAIVDGIAEGECVEMTEIWLELVQKSTRYAF